MATLNNKKTPIKSELAVSEDLTGKEIAVVDITKGGNLPDLSKMAVLQVDLVGQYWTPETLGESKRLVFMGIEKQEFESMETKGVYAEKDVVNFMENINGTWVKISSASARLTSALKGAKVNQCYEITYNGEVKNKTNGLKGHAWSVKHLMA